MTVLDLNSEPLVAADGSFSGTYPHTIAQRASVRSARVRVRTNPDTTFQLIHRIRAGDNAARDALLRRYLPLLKRWARGRTPQSARDTCDTDDFVQIAVMRALGNIASFDVRRPGCFLAYLREIFLNEVRATLRRFGRTPQKVPLGNCKADLLGLSSAVGQDPLPFEDDRLETYETTLSLLPRRQQELLLMRIEFGMTYPEIAIEVNSTPDAVRVMTTRAATRLARMLGERCAAS